SGSHLSSPPSTIVVDVQQSRNGVGFVSRESLWGAEEIEGLLPDRLYTHAWFSCCVVTLARTTSSTYPETNDSLFLLCDFSFSPVPGGPHSWPGPARREG